MRISIITAFALLCLTLAAGTAWAYSASVHIYVYNDDNESMDVDIEYEGGDKIFTLDSGDDHEFESSATAWFEDPETYAYDVYVSASDDIAHHRRALVGFRNGPTAGNSQNIRV